MNLRPRRNGNFILWNNYHNDYEPGKESDLSLSKVAFSESASHFTSLQNKSTEFIKRCLWDCGLPTWLSGKESSCQMHETQETQVWSLGREEPLEEEMTTLSSTLAWKIPWTKEPGGLQSMGSQRVGHDWETEQSGSRRGKVNTENQEKFFSKPWLASQFILGSSEVLNLCVYLHMWHKINYNSFILKCKHLLQEPRL